MPKIETMADWNELAAKLAEHRYSLYQWQYGTDRPEGLIARFWKAAAKDIYVRTFNPAVEKAIINFKLPPEDQ